MEKKFSESSSLYIFFLKYFVSLQIIKKNGFKTLLRLYDVTIKISAISIEKYHISMLPILNKVLYSLCQYKKFQ